MAGITIATELESRGLSICLIEAGGLDPDPWAQRMFAGEIAGRPYYRLDQSRHRVFGGSSIRWGGYCLPLDAQDFEQRDWIPLSGWPISLQDLASGYGRAARMLGLAAASFAVDDWADRHPPLPSVWTSEEFEPAVIQAPVRLDFGIASREHVGRSADITALLHANVTLLELEPGTRRVGHAQIANRVGERFEIRARTFVLAAGGIENARLLLASADSGVGLGDESGWVGRCFMEHLHGPLGYIVPAAHGELPPFFEWTSIGDARVHGVLAPSASALRDRQAPSCSFTLGTVPRVRRTAPLLGVPPGTHAAYRRLRRRHPAVAARLRRHTFSLWNRLQEARTFHDARHATRRGRRYLHTLYVRGEQMPNPQSRVTLSSRRDALGMPQARLDWQVLRGDVDGVRTWAHALDQTLRRSGLGHLVLPPQGWEDSLRGGPHHLGTTRMSSSPQSGVVDADCRVHTLDNLYVAGGSVFTTSGHANPSLTIMALALRLADHLGQDLAQRPPPARSHPLPSR